MSDQNIVPETANLRLFRLLEALRHDREEVRYLRPEERFCIHRERASIYRHQESLNIDHRFRGNRPNEKTTLIVRIPSELEQKIKFPPLKLKS